MSPLFDAPAHLIVLLASIAAGQDAPNAPMSVAQRPAVEQHNPYAFSDATWLEALRHGFGGVAAEPYKARIFSTSGGRVYVPVASDMAEIVAAKQNPSLARAVAIDMTRSNGAALKIGLGHSADIKDLYVAHILGLDAAMRLASLKAVTPGALLAETIPEMIQTPHLGLMATGPKLTIAGFYARLPGAEIDAALAARSSMVADGDATANMHISADASQPVERWAPLRGIIIDREDKPAAWASSASRQLAEAEPPHDWETSVRPAAPSAGFQ